MVKLALSILAVMIVMVNSAGCIVQPPAKAAAAWFNEPDRTEEPGTTVALPPEAAYWTARGIHFEGPWQEDEIEMVIAVLARFADRLGEARFLALVRKAVLMGTGGARETLTFRRDVDVVGLVGTWAFHEGRITLYDGLFDPEHLEDSYALRFEHHLEHVPSGPVSPPMFTVAHELGHALVEGLRQELVAEALAPTLLEDAYAESVALDARAHPFHSVKENVVSEIGLWVLEVPRSPAVDTYREDYLAPALLDE